MSDPKLLEEIKMSGLFDADWYAARYRDVALSGLAPLEHYLWLGMALTRDPGPEFSARYYQQANPDIQGSGLAPLLHFLRYGRAEGRAATQKDAEALEAKRIAEEGIPPRPASMPGDAQWDFHLATDAFMRRGLRPSAPYVVVVNAQDDVQWDAAQAVLAGIGIAHDVLLLGSDSYDFSDMATDMAALALAGDADEADNARSFVRLAGDADLSDYRAVLWLSMPDLPEGAGTEELQALAAQMESFAASSGWALASDEMAVLDNDADPLVQRAMKIALPRLGLTWPEDSVAYASGAGVLIKPVLLRALGPSVRPFEMTPDGAAGTFPGRAAALAMLGLAAHRAGMHSDIAPPVVPPLPATAAKRDVKAVAFYLPQYHPIPENDLWWGKGFTEWTNVTRGKPLFRNHDQPRVPTDLGFYDLRLEDTQAAQADLARDFGIHGFCYYYYWFNGKKLLNQPIEQMAASTRTDAGFCVCWANENWSRNWDGQNRHVLMKQDYSLESNIALIREMIPMMKDPRWIRHKGRPVMVVYRISIIPNWLETARIWREECRAAGLGEIHLCAVRFGLEMLDGQPGEHGLDAYVLFPPHEAPRLDLRDKVLDLHKDFGGEIFSYDAVVDGDSEKFADGYKWPVHRGAMLGWDNTARRLTDARVFHGATPYGFRNWIKTILEQENAFNPEPESLMFINAWNEWAEGTYLEPDKRWGRSYLQAFSSAAAEVPGIHPVTVLAGTAKRPKDEDGLIDQGRPLLNGGTALAAPDWTPGARVHDPERPTVMLCAHVAGHQLFGGERSMLDVLEALAAQPVNVIVTLPSANNAAYLKAVSGLCTGVYSFAYPQWVDARRCYAWLALNFADILARHGVDVVHANTIMLIEPLVAARRLGRTTVTHSREIISLDRHLLDRINLPASEILSTVFARSDWVIGNSAATCALFQRPGRTLYVPNAVAPADLDMGNKYGRTLKFGIVSSNILTKGIADFMEVARCAAGRVENARFVVVGPENDDTRRWKREIEAGERPANVTFAGYRNSPRAAMAELNVLLNLSSFAESFGRTVAEALAGRRPVIGYDWGALGELIQHGKTGYLVGYRDIEGVVDAVSELCADPERVKAMGEAGRAFISGNFAKANLKSALSEGYEAILGTETSAPAPAAAPAAARIGTPAGTTVVIPVYNAADEVRNCLESVLRHTDLRREKVLVIDDGSPEPDVAPMLAEFEGTPGLTIMRNDPNIGYTCTINRGIEIAGRDDVILLNSDTIVTPKWLEGLRATAYSRAGVGTVTAMSDNAGAFSFPVFNEHCPKPDHLGHDAYALMMLGQTFDCTPPEVPTGSGFCMYIRRAMMDACGTFDHEAFPRGYGEENDFCMRGRAAGWINLVSPWSFVYHVRTASFKGEKVKLVQAGVDVVTKRYPDYAALNRAAFSAPDMQALRDAATGIA